MTELKKKKEKKCNKYFCLREASDLFAEMKIKKCGDITSCKFIREAPAPREYFTCN
jgi:hypothetical protein